MAGPRIDNATAFAFAPLFVADESGRPIVSTIVKATYDVTPRGLTLAEEQLPVDFSGKHHGEPGQSSVRIDPEIAFTKPGSDCVLLGHAIAPHPTPVMDVTFAVGPVAKTVRVNGDRWWVLGGVGLTMTSPQPFERIPLVYERAFGGWDRSSENPAEHACEPRNPVGVGFAARSGSVMHGAPMPNIEDPASPLTSPTGRCTPAGFGFIGCDWEPRVRLAGTYDDAWSKTRSPLLPVDFDRRFFNAASDGLSTVGYLRGDERVAAIGVTPEGRWEFSLPAIQAPRCTIALRYGSAVTLQTNLDTVIVDADARRLTMLWRAFAPLRTGPHDVSDILIDSDNAPRPVKADADAVAAPSS
jgi:hypothetical protein